MPRPVDEIFDDAFLASLYDHLNPWSSSDDFYLQRARASGGPVLDLGCGTGMLAVRIASEGLEVAGVDPAAGMLKVARSRPGAERVTWFECDGQNLDLARRFKCIYMTGHAFQTLLTDEDAIAVLSAAGRHLSPDGRFIFESRNPAAREWQEWRPGNSWTVEIAPHGRVEESVDTTFDEASGIARITHRYRFLDRGTERVSNSRIRFIDHDHIARLIEEAGLKSIAWYGDWDRRPLSLASKEIVAVTGRAERR
jgi:ubiquinone/menaquinone biosynthesis C-methylase UbiE